MIKRNFLIVITLIVTTIITSCKKSEQQNPTTTENPTTTDKVLFYENLPNNSDGLIAEVQLNKESANAFIYGTSDSIGSPSHIKSMAYKINNNDTVYNFIFDNLNRIKIVYAKLNNVNLNQLIRFDYLTNDTVITNIYKYNWVTRADSLLYQFKGKGSNQTKIYGARFSLSNLFKGDANAIVTSFIITGLAIAALPVAVYAAGIWITGSTAISIFGGAVTALTLVGSIAGAQEYQPIKNPNAPISPTSSFIPNPTGTPTIPASSVIYGKWRWYQQDIDGVVTPRVGSYLWFQENGTLKSGAGGPAGVNWDAFPPSSWSLYSNILYVAGESCKVISLDSSQLIYQRTMYLPSKVYYYFDRN